MPAASSVTWGVVGATWEPASYSPPILCTAVTKQTMLARALQRAVGVREKGWGRAPEGWHSRFSQISDTLFAL